MAGIIRVLGPDGELWHDCNDAGCEVVWDGIVWDTGRPAQGREEPPHQLGPVEDGEVRVIEIHNPPRPGRRGPP